MSIDTVGSSPAKRTGTATSAPLTMAGPSTVSRKVPALAAIIPPSSAPTPSMPAWSPENRLAPGWCQTTSGLSRLIAVGTSPWERAPKYEAETSAGVWKVLADTLRDLERDGLVTRTSYDEMPPRVEYELTPLGRTLREPLTALARWAEQHVEEVLDARDGYDASARPTSTGPRPRGTRAGGRETSWLRGSEQVSARA